MPRVADFGGRQRKSTGKDAEIHQRKQYLPPTFRFLLQTFIYFPLTSLLCHSRGKVVAQSWQSRRTAVAKSSHGRDTIFSRPCDGILTAVRRYAHVCATIVSRMCDDLIVACNYLNLPSKYLTVGSKAQMSCKKMGTDGHNPIEYPQKMQPLARLISLCVSEK